MKFFSFILISFFIFGCKESTQLDEKPHQLVVSAFLVAEEKIDSVFVTQLEDMLSFYDPNTAAVQNANVTITLVDQANSAGNITYTLTHDARMPGRYYSSAIVQPMKKYLLSVEAPGFPRVTGSTSVPDTFSITNKDAFPDTLTYNSESPAEYIGWTASRNHAYYLCLITCLDANAEEIPNQFRNKDDPKPGKTSGIFTLPDNYFAELSWFMVNYYGRTQISVEATDTNCFDYFKQQIVSNRSELREIRYSLQGGLGIFSSSARAHGSPIVVIKP
jgi:hypothetical protein